MRKSRQPHCAAAISTMAQEDDAKPLCADPNLDFSISRPGQTIATETLTMLRLVRS
jgi:hypothetical protein